LSGKVNKEREEKEKEKIPKNSNQEGNDSWQTKPRFTVK
jgi:hypothetical protein